ncbi:hypothetical protein [Nibribacter koreensis]|uniref:Uncharacterized protein n=1 Tax=Nibribacter koreensis TaxID=1084519 RepID=A0ABP8FB52_9BACT
MSDKLELLKSNTVLFTIELTKKSLSDWVVEDIIALNQDFEDIPLLDAELNSNQDIKRIKDFLKNEIKPLDEAVYEACLEELKEIKEDLTWQTSEDGALVLKLEDWVQDSRTHLERKGWSHVLVGRSLLNPTQLNIINTMQNLPEASSIKVEIEKLKPPVKPHYFLDNI